MFVAPAAVPLPAAVPVLAWPRVRMYASAATTTSAAKPAPAIHSLRACAG